MEKNNKNSACQLFKIAMWKYVMTFKYKINQKYMLQSFIMTSLVLEYISPSTISLLWKYKKDIRVERREKKK